MRGLPRVVTITVVASCGGAGDPPIESGAADGTRLHVRWWDVEGVRVVVNEPNGPFFRDTLLGLDCRAVNWNDGTSSCAPVELGGGYAEIMYADAGCTQPLAPIRTGTTCGAPRFAIEYDAAGATTLVPVGAPSTVTQYYDLTSGDCIGPLQVAGSPFTFHETGAPVARDELAPLTVGAPRGGGRVQLQSMESDDGFRFPLFHHDAELDATCYIREVGDGWRCQIPAQVWGRPFYYADAACTDQPLLEESLASERFVTSAALADEAQKFYEVGPEVVPSPLYGGYDAASCQVRDPMGQRFFQPIERQLATLARAPVASSARIAPMVLSGDGTRILDGIYDRDFESGCEPQPMADGSVRCLPSTGGVRAYYTDSTCTTSVELHEHILARGAPPLFLVRGTSNGCTGGIAEIYTLGPVRTGTVFDRATPTLCVPHQAPGGEIVPAEYYTIGEPVSPSVFATATLAVGP